MGWNHQPDDIHVIPCDTAVCLCLMWLFNRKWGSTITKHSQSQCGEIPEIKGNIGRLAIKNNGIIRILWDIMGKVSCEFLDWFVREHLTQMAQIVFSPAETGQGQGQRNRQRMVLMGCWPLFSSGDASIYYPLVVSHSYGKLPFIVSFSI